MAHFATRPSEPDRTTSALRRSLDVEFGAYSEWLMDAIEDIGPREVVPSACRGTAHPELFAFLGDALHVNATTRFLDIGSGLGGPAAWLIREFECRVFGVDVMQCEVVASTRLFPDLPAVVGVAEQLPLRDESFDAAWALGVLEMVGNRTRALQEAGSVLRPGGRLGIYGYFSTSTGVRDSGGPNRFEHSTAFIDRLRTCGFDVIRAQPSDRPPMPATWRASVDSVRAEVRRRHSDDARLLLAEIELGSFNWLRVSGRIEDWTIVAEKRA